MQRNLWAETQARIYLDAAHHLRQAAKRQHDEAITHNLEDIAVRYEKLGKTLEALSTTSNAA